jgi:hypothetical protein
MRTITARDIQVFVAGALASAGFHAVISLVYNIGHGWNAREVFAWAMVGLLLPLGIGILLRNHLALLLTQIYLWIVVIGGIIAPVVSGLLQLGAFRIRFLGAYAAGVGLDCVLLALLLWSKSGRFADARNA